MLVYRRKHAETIARARARFPQDISDFDLDLLYKGDFWKECVRFIPRGTSDDCYVELLIIREVDFEAVLAWSSAEVVELAVSALEMYTVVLHNQSVATHRMCQISFVEDACGFPISVLYSPVRW